MKKLLPILALALHVLVPGRAATFTVTNTADSGAGSLRAAITSANSTTGVDSIAFSGTSGVITLVSSPPAISDDVSIIGPGSSTLTVSGNAQVRILTVTANKRVTISKLQFANGKSNSSPGAAIANAGILVITDCVFSSNTVLSNSGDGYGGAISNTGNLTVLTSQFSNNAAQGVDGYSPGFSGSGYGGAVHSAVGPLQIESCDFTTNNAFGGSGTSSFTGVGRSGGYSYGGAVYLAGGTATIRRSMFVVNRATGGGGSAAYGGGAGSGGSAYGGAIHRNFGDILVEDCSFASNEAVGGNGASTSGAFNHGGNGGWGRGGAIADGGVQNAIGIQLNRLTLSSNRARAGGRGLGDIGNDGVAGDALGGAIYGNGTFTNCTVSQNSANKGAGISATSGTLLHCTIVSNAASSGASGGVTPGPSLKNNLISGNTPSETNGTVTSIGHNLFGASAGITGGLQASDLRDVAAPLGLLQDNGGPTKTHALLAGNPARDSADSNGAPTTDQRGIARPPGGAPDIGAYESSVLEIAVDGTPVLPGYYARATAATVSLTTLYTGGEIHYTLDDSTPTLASPLYSTPIQVGSTASVRAIAVDANLASPVLAGPVVLSFGPMRTLTVDASGLGSVARKPGSGPYPDGATVTLTPIPAAGWIFEGWSGALAGNASPALIAMDADKAVQAIFVQGPSYTLNVTQVGQGIVIRNPSAASYLGGSFVTLTATPAVHWSFSNWSGDATGTSSPITIIVDGNKSVTANFAALLTYTLSITKVGQGTVTPAPPGGIYDAGSSVTLTATPATNWVFAGWSGAVNSTSPSQYVTMDANKAVTATFTALPTYDLIVSQIGQGTVTLNPAGGAYLPGTTVTLTANPPLNGWVFNGWRGALSGDLPKSILTMNENKTVTASFRPDSSAHWIPSSASSSLGLSAVCLSGNLLAMAMDGDTAGGANTGRVTVYDLASANPAMPMATLIHPRNGTSPVPSLAMAGTLLVVGTPAYSSAGLSGVGRAYVYDLASANSTTPVLTIEAPTVAASEVFGISVGISGHLVAVGADGHANFAGIVYVYDLASANPASPAFVLSLPTATKVFGRHVAISGTRVAVGALNGIAGTGTPGIVYVFDLSSATPTTPAVIIENPTPASYDFFGEALSMDGAKLVVGAYYDDAGATDSGTAYVFDLNGTPSTMLTLNNPRPDANDNFGWSVAISGNRVVVGARSDSTLANLGESASGIAYLYDLSRPAPTVPTVTLCSPTFYAGDYFSDSVAIAGNTIAVCASGAGLYDSGAVATFGVLPPDSDNDGLYDSWEFLYWPSLAGHSASTDTDGDGLSDLQELAFGLNPLVPDTALAPQPFNENGYLTISLTKFRGATYEVQSAGTLFDGQPDSFSAATTTTLLNTSTTLKVRDNVSIGSLPGRFLRVKVLSAP